METSTFERLKNTYTLLPLHVGALWAIYNIVTGVAPTWWLTATILGYICFKMLGVGACFHRMLSHKAFETHRIVKLFALWCGTVAGQGSPVFWTTVHRGYHHRFSDTDKDLHSPKDGFWHAYFLWLFRINYATLNLKYAINVLKDKDAMIFHNHYNKIFIFSHLIIAMISFDLWLYFTILPCMIAFHSFAIQTSVVHYPKLGYRNYDTKDSSVNVPWIWPVSTGECWHNNHHGDPGNPNFGHKNWWELDPTFWLIKLIRKS